MRSFPTVAALSCAWFAACLPEFDPDLGNDGVAISEAPACGAQGSLCCPAPSEPCERDLVCDAEQQRCMREPVLLCHGDEECRQGEVCCMAGLVGTCERGAQSDCPALDLVVVTPELDADPVEIRSFDPTLESDRCLIERGCVGGPGPRRLLGVSTIVNNIGTADLLLGSPDDTAAPTTATCAGEPRFAAFLRFELVDSTGPKLRQDVAAACSAAGPGPFITPFNCDFQGIWSGFSQAYPSLARAGAAADDCRWLDITDLLPGEYTLRVTVNPDEVFEERNFGNNTPAELPIAIPEFGDPAARCPEPPNPLLGSSAERECGWVRAPFQSDGQATPCSPGSYLSLICTSDNVQYVCGDYRVCGGPDICSYGDSIPPAYDTCFALGGFTVLQRCPDTGLYSLWLPSDSPDDFRCEPYVDEFSSVTSAPDAGAPVEP